MTATSVNGALSSLSNLVGKLLPHAKDELVIFRRNGDRSDSHAYCPAISVRTTPDFLGCIAYLSRQARDNDLAYAVADMSVLEHAWLVKQLLSPKAILQFIIELCVSSSEVWIRADMHDTWSRVQFETTRIPLLDICPINLIPVKDKTLPGRVRRSAIKLYADRLEALQEV